MPVLHLETKIYASIEVCFDLSRSIDLHMLSTEHTGEKAVAGVTTGLIGLGEFVTWKAKHFGVWQHLTSRITEFQRPTLFVDEMERGAFNRFRHAHQFREEDGHTLLQDAFDYTSPFGLVGTLADALFLKEYMRRLLVQRNKVIKEYAESEKAVEILNITRDK